MQVTFDRVANYLQDTHKRVSIIFKTNEQSVLLRHDLPVKLIVARAVKTLSNTSAGKYTLTDGFQKFALDTLIGDIEADRLMVVNLEAEAEDLTLPPPRQPKVEPEPIEKDETIPTRPTDDQTDEMIDFDQEPEPPLVFDKTLNEADISPAGAMMGTMIERRGKLEFIDVETNKRYPVNEFPAIIGRKEGNPDASLVAVDLSGSPKVSRSHVQITERDGKYEVMNLSTRNRLMVNDDEVKVAFIKDGDILMFGEVQLRVHFA